MKETEITVEVLGDIQDTKTLLVEQNFKVKESIKMTDYYFSKLHISKLLQLDYAELIKNSIIVRNVKTENETISQILYKDKVLDENNNIIAEEKITTNISDFNSTIKIFDTIGLTCYSKLVQNMTVYSNDNISFILQEVEDLGNFIEYEEDEDMYSLSEQEKINLMLDNLRKLNLNIGSDYSCKKVYLKLMKDN